MSYLLINLFIHFKHKQNISHVTRDILIINS